MTDLFLSAAVFCLAFIAVLATGIHLCRVWGRKQPSVEQRISIDFWSRVSERRWLLNASLLFIAGVLLRGFGLGGPVKIGKATVTATYPWLSNLGGLLILLVLAFALYCMWLEYKIFNLQQCTREEPPFDYGPIEELADRK